MYTSFCNPLFGFHLRDRKLRDCYILPIKSLFVITRVGSFLECN